MATSELLSILRERLSELEEHMAAEHQAVIRAVGQHVQRRESAASGHVDFSMSADQAEKSTGSSSLHRLVLKSKIKSVRLSLAPPAQSSGPSQDEDGDDHDGKTQEDDDEVKTEDDDEDDEVEDEDIRSAASRDPSLKKLSSDEWESEVEPPDGSPPIMLLGTPRGNNRTQIIPGSVDESPASRLSGESLGAREIMPHRLSNTAEASQRVQRSANAEAFAKNCGTRSRNGFPAGKNSFRAPGTRDLTDMKSLNRSYTRETGLRFCICPVWIEEECLLSKSLSRTQTDPGLRKARTSAKSKVSEEMKPHEHSGSGFGAERRIFFLQPNDPKRMFWDLMGMILIASDLIFVPLQLFEMPATLFDICLGWVARLFWTADMPCSFITGFIRADGTMEMRPSAIARRYARTWLFMDMVVICSEWLGVLFSIVGAGTDLAGDESVKTMRIARMLRMMRLLRAARMPSLFGKLVELAGAAEFVLTCDIMKILFFFMGVAHLIACFWYAIGFQGVEGERNWVQMHGYDEVRLGERYVTSLHWSVTQFIGAMEIFPYNWLERSYAVVVLVFAFITSASFVSSITSAMTRHHITRTQQVNQMTTLHRYLRQNAISHRLSLRIQRNAQFAVQEQQRNVPEAKVDLLHMVSEPLRIELHFEIYAPDIQSHCFFERYYAQNQAALRKICHGAVTVKTLSSGDVLFHAGEIPTRPEMFFNRHGVLEYSAQDEVEVVQDGGLLSEAALWVACWTHCGTLRATSDGRMLALNAVNFQDISCQFHDEEFLIHEYALNFVDLLNTDAQQLGGTRLSDVGRKDSIEKLVLMVYQPDNDDGCGSEPPSSASMGSKGRPSVMHIGKVPGKSMSIGGGSKGGRRPSILTGLVPLPGIPT